MEDEITSGVKVMSARTVRPDLYKGIIMEFENKSSLSRGDVVIQTEEGWTDNGWKDRKNSL